MIRDSSLLTSELKFWYASWVYFLLPALSHEFMNPYGIPCHSVRVVNVKRHVRPKSPQSIGRGREFEHRRRRVNSARRRDSHCKLRLGRIQSLSRMRTADIQPGPCSCGIYEVTNKLVRLSSTASAVHLLKPPIYVMSATKCGDLLRSNLLYSQI